MSKSDKPTEHSTISKSRENKEKAIAISIASSLASIIAKFATHPIDTIKAKLQVSRMEMRTLSDVKLGGAIELGI